MFDKFFLFMYATNYSTRLSTKGSLIMVSPEEENKSKSSEPHTVPGFVDLCKSNIGDTIAYVLVAAGLILCFFHPFSGSLLVGMIVGLYFSPLLFQALKTFREFLVQEGIFKGFIVMATAAVFLIVATGFTLGIIIGALAYPFFKNHIHPPLEKK
jgi:hypothetical protein